jgi:DNA processing protein
MGALSSACGSTVGVLGCGIDVVYPKENKKIFAEIEQRGVLISEFSMGTFPAPQNFPIRDRIIGEWRSELLSWRRRSTLDR